MADPWRGYNIGNQNLQNALTTIGNQDIARDRNRIADERTDLSRQQVGMQQQKFDQKGAVERFNTMAKLIPSVTDEASYQQFLNTMNGLFGPDPNVPKQYAGNEQWVESLKKMAQQAQGGDETQGATMKTWTLPDGTTVNLPNNEKPPKGAVPYKKEKPGALKTWVLPDGTTVNLPNNEAPPEGAVPYSSGMDIEIGEGTTRIRTGVPQGGGDMTRKTKGMFEQKITDFREQRIRAEDILAQFDPAFVTIPGKLKGVKLNVMDKLGMDLSPEDAEFLDNISTFTQDAIENINLYIKAITGAQMSEAEAKRLRKAMADVGDGVLSGDGPRKFVAKAKNTIRKAKLSEARYVLLREKGFEYETGEGAAPGSARKIEGERNKERMEARFGYKRVEQMLRNRADEIGAQMEMSNPDMTTEEIKAEVKKQMRERYGI